MKKIRKGSLYIKVVVGVLCSSVFLGACAGGCSEKQTNDGNTANEGTKVETEPTKTPEEVAAEEEANRLAEEEQIAEEEQRLEEERIEAESFEQRIQVLEDEVLTRATKLNSDYPIDTIGTYATYIMLLNDYTEAERERVIYDLNQDYFTEYGISIDTVYGLFNGPYLSYGACFKNLMKGNSISEGESQFSNMPPFELVFDQNNPEFFEFLDIVAEQSKKVYMDENWQIHGVDDVAALTTAKLDDENNFTEEQVRFIVLGLPTSDEIYSPVEEELRNYSGELAEKYTTWQQEHRTP